MLQLHCKRSKIFIRHNGDRTEKATCARGETTSVPDWVKDDPGYAMGIKDKSIVDLTPPKPANVPEPESESKPESSTTEESGEDQTTTEIEEAPRRPVKSNVPKGLQGAGTVVKSK